MTLDGWGLTLPQATTAIAGKESEFKSVHIFDLQLETESIFRQVYQVLQNMSTSLQCEREVFSWFSVCLLFYSSVQEKGGVSVCACVFQGVLLSREAEDMVKVWEVVGE